MVSLSVNITVTSAAATAVNLTPIAPFSGSGSDFTAQAPIPANMVVATIVVQPSSWQGTLSLSGTDAAQFRINGMQLVTAIALVVGNYNVIVTANGTALVLPSAPTGLTATPK